MADNSEHLFNEPAPDAETSKKSRTLVSVGKIIALALLIVFVFGLGVNVGTGRITFNSSHSNNPQLPKQLDYTSVNQVYQELKNNYDGKLDGTKLLDGLKAGLTTAAGDPHTEYFSASEAKEFNNQLSGTFTGIGAELGQDSKGNLQVIAPISGFPAARAGLRAQDLIIAIDDADTTGLSVGNAVSRIRGPKGTTVKLQVIRGGQTLVVPIVRDNIKVPSVKHEVLDHNIGYIQITQFSEDTVPLAREAATSFQKAGVKGIVLDLRDNPGGLLEGAVNVSSLWLPSGKKIVQEKRDVQVINTHYADGTELLDGLPTAVLINGGSASASEIVAGALRDNNAATLFGVKSYGKGSVQTVLNLSGGTELKVTVARWYRPNGQNIDKKGITPDKVITQSEDDFKNKRDPQKDAAITWLQTQIKQ